MRLGAGLLAIGLLLFAAGWLVTRTAPFGAAPDGERLARISQSERWFDGRFHNAQPQWVDTGTALFDLVRGRASPDASPREPVASVAADAVRLATLPASGLRLTWFGHSSALLEIDGSRVLVDPFWGQRASPFSFLGPQRWYAPPLAVAQLPPIDAVVISHDHYDHLDRDTVTELAARTRARFIVPLGLGAHLQRWGIEASRIDEIDWWTGVSVGQLTITATPARHSTGRISPTSSRTLWAGYAMVGPQHRVWYSGDTGYHDELAEIGRRLGPFDLALVDAGQYNEHWPDNHLGPEQAVDSGRRAGARLIVPVHWALLQLAPHAWTEPVERVLARARCLDQPVLVLQPGRSIEPEVEPAPPRWWPALATRVSADDPIVSTLAGDPQQRYPGSGCPPLAVR